MNNKVKRPILNLMIDIETLGTQPGCIILQVAMKSFMLGSGEPDCDIVRNDSIDVLSSLMYGFKADDSTVAWWNDPSRSEALELLNKSMKHAMPIDSALQFYYNSLNKLNEDYDLYLYGRGIATFDLPILDFAMRKVVGDCYRTPWKYWQVMDLRSIDRFCHVLGMEKNPTDTPHDAMADCEKQIKEAQRCASFVLKGKALSLQAIK